MRLFKQDMSMILKQLEGLAYRDIFTDLFLYLFEQGLC